MVSLLPRQLGVLHLQAIHTRTAEAGCVDCRYPTPGKICTPSAMAGFLIASPDGGTDVAQGLAPEAG